MEQEVAAMIELAAGRRDQAIAGLKEASAAELKLPPPLGLPVPIKPAPELLGETLLDAGQLSEALNAFASALGRNANRTRSVLGLARATRALGRTDESRTHYQSLLETLRNADAGLPELAEARSALAEEPAVAPKTQTGPSRQMLLSIVTGISALGIFVALYSRRWSGRVPRSTASGKSGGRRKRRR
jgi:tetratricopeptide (TPR) repeat protein